MIKEFRVIQEYYREETKQAILDNYKSENRREAGIGTMIDKVRETLQVLIKWVSVVET